jgi:hypothetical protein
MVFWRENGLLTLFLKLSLMKATKKKFLKLPQKAIIGPKDHFPHNPAGFLGLARETDAEIERSTIPAAFDAPLLQSARQRVLRHRT